MLSTPDSDRFCSSSTSESLCSLEPLLTPIRVPYTVAKFVVYEKVAEAIYRRVDKSQASSGMQTTINLGSGLIAGFAAAFVSQPADTMLSKINKTKGLPGEGTTSRLIKIARELGLRGSYTGIGARLFMVRMFRSISNSHRLHGRVTYCPSGVVSSFRCFNLGIVLLSGSESIFRLSRLISFLDRLLGQSDANTINPNSGGHFDGRTVRYLWRYQEGPW